MRFNSIFCLISISKISKISISKIKLKKIKNKFEVIQSIVFGAVILNLGSPKSEILYFLVMHFFLTEHAL